MGYTTYFEGHISIEPPLNEHEISYLDDFARSRRMKRTGGPYIADPGADMGQYGFGRQGRQPEDEILEFNDPPDGQPGLWCQWVPTADGTRIIWDEGEKFYRAPEWMAYLIDHFLKAGAEASGVIKDRFGRGETLPDARLEHFTFDHVLNGEIHAQGEDPDDRWILQVVSNEVYERLAVEVRFGEPRKVT